MTGLEIRLGPQREGGDSEEKRLPEMISISEKADTTVTEWTKNTRQENNRNSAVKAKTRDVHFYQI